MSDRITLHPIDHHGLWTEDWRVSGKKVHSTITLSFFGFFAPVILREGTEIIVERPGVWNVDH